MYYRDRIGFFHVYNREIGRFSNCLRVVFYVQRRAILSAWRYFFYKRTIFLFSIYYLRRQLPRE